MFASIRHRAQAFEEGIRGRTILSLLIVLAVFILAPVIHWGFFSPQLI